MSASVKPQVHTLSPDYLNSILPGCTIQLQFHYPSMKRVVAKLIGYEKDKYVLLRLADTGNWHHFSHHFFETNNVVARMVVNTGRGECIAFKSSIRWTSTNPINLLYLDIPDCIEKAELRAHQRVPTCIYARLSDSISSPVSGNIKDVSLGGCRFEFELPEGKQAVADKPVTIAAGDNVFMIADVKNQHNVDDNTLSVGMQFRTSANETQDLLSRLYVPPSALVAC